MKVEDEPRKVFLVYLQANERGDTGELAGVFASRPKARSYARGRGHMGCDAEINRRSVVLDDGLWDGHVSVRQTMAKKATARTWRGRMGPAYDRATGSEPDSQIIRDLAKIMEATETELPEDVLDTVTALMYEAHEAGQVFTE